MAELLLIDDQDRYLALCRKVMPHHRFRGPARSWAEASRLLTDARGRVDLVLLDVHLDRPPGELVGWREGMSPAELEQLRRRQGLHVLGALRGKFPDLPVVLMTSRAELQLEADADRLNAEEYTYFLDDEQINGRTLTAAIENLLAAQRGEESDGPIFWGRTPAMRRIRQRLAVLARGRLPVVLLGPTGTGKSLLARHFVHPRSGRSGQFVAVDLATVPRDLMAAHLFGSVKGAYTGSVADRVGAFEAASGGTLFLDEVGNLSLDAQKLLLSVLQEGTVTRVGDLRERAVDVKLVVATNEDLAARVRDGTFRADLYMRLNPATAVVLPGLADRTADLDRLLQFSLDVALTRPYLRGLVEEYRAAHGLPGGSVVVRTEEDGPAPSEGLTLLFPERSHRLLQGHEWPGNLREFSMVVENAVLFALAEMTVVPGRGADASVVQVRPKLVRDLLRASVGAADDPADEGGPGLPVSVRLAPADSLNKVAVEVERQYFTWLWTRERGDFAAMSEVLLGDRAAARKVQLRFNQLGLKVRELKEQIGH
jgi:two-component system nitrogen regulation response regulator GlnG